MFCPDSAVVVVIQIFDEFLFEVLHGLKFSRYISRLIYAYRLAALVSPCIVRREVSCVIYKVIFLFVQSFSNGCRNNAALAIILSLIHI